MDILNKLITEMNKEDVRYFKLYISRTKTAEARKDTLLFDYIRKSGNNYKDEKIFKKLYEGKNKNAFYRLKNRMIEDINRCMIAQHFQEDNVLYVFHLLSLARFYFKRNNHKLSLHFLRKAESKTKQLDNYELLDIIYGEFINLSNEMVSGNIEDYILKRQQNRKQLNIVRQFDDILSVVKYRLATTQNFSRKDNSILTLLEGTINNFTIDEGIKKSPKLRFNIYDAVSQILLQRYDYKTLESYLLKTYDEFLKDGLFHKENHNTKLQMLTFIINALFKNNKIKESLKYVEHLKDAMNEFNKILYDKYLFFYYNSLVINYSILDKDKAIDILNGVKEKEVLKSTPFFEIFVYLNLAILWFDKKQFHKAIKNLNTLYMHNNYKNADTVLKFKITIAELLIRFELNDHDYLEHKITQVKKDFKEILIKKEYKKEQEFIHILYDMIVADNIKKGTKLFQQIKNFIKNNTSDDTEIIKYNTWLQEKL